MCVVSLWLPERAAAQPTLLSPMNVESYRVLQRVSRNAGWASTAYRNYLVGLFEGLLGPEAKATDDRRLFCLPIDRGRVSIAETFEWMELELNKVVANAQPSDLVARIYVGHLTASYPCKS